VAVVEKVELFIESTTVVEEEEEEEEEVHGYAKHQHQINLTIPDQRSLLLHFFMDFLLLQQRLCPASHISLPTYHLLYLSLGHHLLFQPHQPQQQQLRHHQQQLLLNNSNSSSSSNHQQCHPCYYE
jgi:hypothetical protein